MAKQVLLASFVSIGGTDLSNYCSSIELTLEVEDVDATTFGANGWHESLGGLKSGSLALTFKQDVAAAAIDSIMWGYFGTTQAFVVRLNNGVVGAGNPQYSGNVLVRQWNPIGGAPGDLAEVSVTYPTSGAITRATA